MDIQRGRKIVDSDVEWNTKVCVIGTEVATDLFGTWDAVNGTIIVGDSLYKVVGVLEEQGSSLAGSDCLLYTSVFGGLITPDNASRKVVKFQRANYNYRYWYSSRCFDG